MILDLSNMETSDKKKLEKEITDFWKHKKQINCYGVNFKFNKDNNKYQSSWEKISSGDVEACIDEQGIRHISISDSLTEQYKNIIEMNDKLIHFKTEIINNAGYIAKKTRDIILESNNIDEQLRVQMLFHIELLEKELYRGGLDINYGKE